MSEVEVPYDLETLREDARREAQRLLENDGPEALRKQVARLEEQEEQLDEQERRCCRTFQTYNLLRWYLVRIEPDPEQRLMEQFPTEGIAGPFRLWTSQTERYSFPGQVAKSSDSARLELTVERLTAHQYPTDRTEYVELGVPVDSGTTWADAERSIGEKWQQYLQKWYYISEKWNRISDRLDAFEGVLDERGDRPEYQEWTAGERVTERAVKLLSRYNQHAHTVQEMNDLHINGGLLDELGYSDPRSKFTSLQEALRSSGGTYEHGNPHSFVEALAAALDEVDELPDHLGRLARSCKNLVDEPGTVG